MENKDLNKTISQIFESRYTIPLYQRNFAWREEQISRLLKDVYSSFQRNPEGNYFIGSLVVRKRRGEDYEVIDGQQRLTVLSLITRLLGIDHEQRLSYDSRPNVEEFLNAFYSGQNIHELNHPTITYLKEAVETIQTTNLCDESEGRESLTICDDKIRQQFAAYFANHVILVRVEIPEDTDVAAYFEIMNNRGEQLQEHEILKALLTSEIKEPDGIHYDIEKQKEFSLIWDACSQIDEPIQKVFNTNRRRMYFGDNYDDFCFTGLTCGEKAEHTDGYTLDDIINNRHKQDLNDKLDNVADEAIDFADEAKYSSIIDFPNFIMHIFKAFYSEEYRNATNSDVPLDAKFMLKVYDEIKGQINPEEFIYNLFRSKTFFDRYVVKTITTDDNNIEDNISWSLQKVRLNGENMYFVGTFNEDNYMQERALKIITMLQVTFRSRKYKNWLQEVIKWFAKQDSITIPSCDYIELLDRYILQRYDEYNFGPRQVIEKDEPLTVENSISSGVNTPHFLFNFIDYLYWVESRNRIHEIKFSERIKDFDFKYWNSVEHHLSQQKAKTLEGSENYINNLGNLCLLSKGANSRLSDRDVKEKVQSYTTSNMGPNRQIIYAITEAHGYEWNHDSIKDHYNNLLDLLQKRQEILSL